MLKQSSSAGKWAEFCLDMAMLFLAFVCAYRLKFDTGAIGDMDQHLPFFYFAAPVAGFAFYLNGIYRGQVIQMHILILKIAGSLFFSALAAAAFLFLTHATFFSRLLFGNFFLIASILVFFEKFLLRALKAFWFSRETAGKDVLIIGEGKKLDALLKNLTLTDGYESRFVRITKVMPFSQCTPDRLRAMLAENVVDEVYLAVSRSEAGRGSMSTGAICEFLEEYGKVVNVVINLDEEFRYSSINFTYIGALPVLVFSAQPVDPDLLLIKRLMDIAGALAGIVVTLVLLPFIAVAIKIDSPGSVFFVQQRIGQNGRRFKLYKFRTMKEDADAIKNELAALNMHEGPICKFENDPRITRAGSFLRRYSLDELPQFFNVLKGEMSLVGTRPPTPDEVRRYKIWHYRRISMRPGMTGLWQVSGRNRIKDFDKIVEMDIKYMSEWSLAGDIKIMLKTLVLLCQPEKSGAV